VAENSSLKRLRRPKQAPGLHSWHVARMKPCRQHAIGSSIETPDDLLPERISKRIAVLLVQSSRPRVAPSTDPSARRERSQAASAGLIFDIPAEHHITAQIV